jgi:Domain of unknown function (DUF4062)
MSRLLIGKPYAAVALHREIRPGAPVSAVVSAVVERIFLSSLARGEMATIRAAARAAVESLDMRPVMFETQPASAEGSRRALLDQVGTCDSLLLLVGAEYGEPGAR